MVRAQTVCLDTHAVVWAYAGEVERLGKEALALIEHASLIISPAVLLELQLLHEIERIAPTGAAVFDALRSSLGLELADTGFDAVVRAALDESWTRDPFDRLIVAHARVLNLPLITRDRRITTAYADCRWD